MVASQPSVTVPLNMEPAGVTTPLAWFSAVRVNEPVAGMLWQNEDTMLQAPTASISCVPSTGLLPAGDKTMYSQLQSLPPKINA